MKRRPAARLLLAAWTIALPVAWLQPADVVMADTGAALRLDVGELRNTRAHGARAYDTNDVSFFY
jgi:hypothetical protein